MTALLYFILWMSPRRQFYNPLTSLNDYQIHQKNGVFLHLLRTRMFSSENWIEFLRKITNNERCRSFLAEELIALTFFPGKFLPNDFRLNLGHIQHILSFKKDFCGSSTYFAHPYTGKIEMFINLIFFLMKYFEEFVRCHYFRPIQWIRWERRSKEWKFLPPSYFNFMLMNRLLSLLYEIYKWRQERPFFIWNHSSVAGKKRHFHVVKEGRETLFNCEDFASLNYFHNCFQLQLTSLP
jgi:hypothetical protein